MLYCKSCQERSLKQTLDDALQELQSRKQNEAIIRGIVVEDDNIIFLGFSDTDLLDINDYVLQMSREDTVSRRYLKSRTCRDRTTKFDLDNCLSSDSKYYTDDEFVAEFRMLRSNFLVVLDAIKNNIVFQSPRKKKKQRRVELQLLVFLYRLGKKGSDAYNVKISNYFGIGQGTVSLYCRRVEKAILDLKSDIVVWPSDEDKELMKARIKIEYGFQNCIGLIDGTLIELECRPSRYGDSYFCRKSSYAINVQVICDVKRNIIYYYGGWPGSTHDNRAWSNCRVAKNPALYFGLNEYLIGDTAYSLSR